MRQRVGTTSSSTSATFRVSPNTQVSYLKEIMLTPKLQNEGLYEGTDCVVHWKPSAIPFHVEFEISVSNDTCQHLVSIRSIKAKDRVSTKFMFMTSLTEIAPIRTESCSTCRGLLKQAISKSTER